MRKRGKLTHYRLFDREGNSEASWRKTIPDRQIIAAGGRAAGTISG
jgi:hypothetical protein